MTIVLIVSSEDAGEINAYADSRVSDENPLLNGVAKLLPLSVRVFDANNKIKFNNSLVSASLQSLRTDTGSDIPTLKEISEFVALMLKKTAKELGANVTHPKNVQTNVFIFGYCPVEKARKFFKVETQISNTFEIGFGELDICEKGTCHSIGDQKAIKMLLSKENSPGVIDYPTALNNLIKSSEAPTVGGDLQAMIAN